MPGRCYSLPVASASRKSGSASQGQRRQQVKSAKAHRGYRAHPEWLRTALIPSRRAAHLL
eukprot:5107899-Pleurochrysis_carterae.AAC.3